MTTASISLVLGGKKTLKRNIVYSQELHALTRQGLPVGALTAMAQEMDVDRKALARIIGISERTLSRRIAKGERLSAEESDRMVRVARVMAQATETLGTAARASHWLQQKNLVLGEVPLELLDTDTGARDVETILMRIEYGIYS